MIDDEKWDLEIKPRANLFSIDLKAIWQYRDLMLLFVRRDFVSQYKQTILGPLWYLIQPILTTFTFLLLFSRIAKIPTDGIHPVVFYMSGITIWTYFSTCLTATSNTFVNNASIFGKVYFPRLVSPLSVVISNMIRFGIQFSLLVVTMIYFAFKGYPFTISIYWIFIPILLVAVASLALGLGIFISSLTTKYRDFTVLIAFSVQLFMYATPIAYPLSFLENTSFGAVVQYNPLSMMVEAFRWIILGHGTVTFSTLAYSFGVTATILFFGILLFNKVEKNFMDTV